MAITEIPASDLEKQEFVQREIPDTLVESTRKRVAQAGLNPTDDEYNALLAYVWPAMVKMKKRDEKYRAIREKNFTTAEGRDYLRELSIDELPGLTTPETTAVMLALSFEMGMPIHFVAPAFGFQKNIPYPDNVKLREMITPIWNICEKFGVSIGFHSGSGKSAENYQVAGQATSSNLEIKTSGRYTYEMGVALSKSSDPYDQALWKDWYNFTIELASNGCFAEDETERKMAREFVSLTLDAESSQRHLQALRHVDLFCEVLNLVPTIFSGSNITFFMCWLPEVRPIKIHSEIIQMLATSNEKDSIRLVIRESYCIQREYRSILSF